MLSCTCFRIFLCSEFQSGEQTDVGRQRLNLSSLLLFSFSELNKVLDINEYHRTRTTKSVWLILGTQKGDNFTCTALLGLHQTSPFALRAEASFCSNMISLRTKFNAQMTVISHRTRSDLLPLPVIFFGVSSVIADKRRVLVIRASCFYITRENLGQAS